MTAHSIQTAIAATTAADSGTGHGSGPGVFRRVAEQCFALLHWFRRLRIRWTPDGQEWSGSGDA